MCQDEALLHPDPHTAIEDWCQARIEYTVSTKLKDRDPVLPVVFVTHYPLVREPTLVLRYPVFAQWCGTTRTHDWHLRYNAAAVVYGHLHIPRHDLVRRRAFRGGEPRLPLRMAPPAGPARRPAVHRDQTPAFSIRPRP